MEEKKIAFREHFSSLPLISANCSLTAFSLEKVFTIFWLPTISSIREVCSPLVSDCSLNMEKVLVAMNLATKNDTGVMHTTTRAMGTLVTSMNTSVPPMVSTPVKSWVKPMSRPSAKVSTSATTRLTISP